MITFPPDPVKVLIFNGIVKRTGQNRTAAALKVAFMFVLILGVTALVGRELLELFGINLDVFSAVGGLVLTLIGFEMLYGSEPGRAQGKAEYDEGPAEDTGLLLPLTTPLSPSACCLLRCGRGRGGSETDDSGGL